MADSYYENAQPRDSRDTTRDSVQSNGDQYQQQYDQSTHGRSTSAESNGAGHYASGNGNGATPVKSEYGAGGGSSAVKQSVKKALTSWVGFSNLPNQVHRRSVR
jgi:septin 7